MGYYLAGFDVVGVDHEPQPHYPFRFIKDDALEYLYKHGEEFDVVHASPPCQFATRASMQWRKEGRSYPNLIAPTRYLLLHIGVTYFIIENVVGSPLLNPIMLNGAMFGLRVKRDRLFETNFTIPPFQLPSQKGSVPMGRPFDARKGSVFYPVGHFSGVAEARIAMEIDWMNQSELSQAIPPAYTRFIGMALLLHHKGRYG